jgi:hypothetical protein
LFAPIPLSPLRIHPLRRFATAVDAAVARSSRSHASASGFAGHRSPRSGRAGVHRANRPHPSRSANVVTAFRDHGRWRRAGGGFAPSRPDHRITRVPGNQARGAARGTDAVFHTHGSGKPIRPVAPPRATSAPQRGPSPTPMSPSYPCGGDSPTPRPARALGDHAPIPRRRAARRPRWSGRPPPPGSATASAFRRGAGTNGFAPARSGRRRGWPGGAATASPSPSRGALRTFPDVRPGRVPADRADAIGVLRTVPPHRFTDGGAIRNHPTFPARPPLGRRPHRVGGPRRWGSMVVLELRAAVLVPPPPQRQADGAIASERERDDPPPQHPMAAEVEGLVSLGTADRVEEEAAEGHRRPARVAAGGTDDHPPPRPRDDGLADRDPPQTPPRLPLPHRPGVQAKGGGRRAGPRSAGGLPNAGAGSPSDPGDPGSGHRAQRAEDCGANGRSEGG